MNYLLELTLHFAQTTAEYQVQRGMKSESEIGNGR